MELKVWVEGVVRVVCGISLDTSCQDVVIALAQAIGQTGRYVLILRLRGTDKQLVADDCPLQQLTRLGQLAAEVQFILRRTGPSQGGGQDKPSRQQQFPLPRPQEPEPLKSKGLQKALSFSLGHSTNPMIAMPSPIPFRDPLSTSSKEGVFRHILQQKRKLHDLEVTLSALEQEVWEQEATAAGTPTWTAGSEEEMEELEQQLQQNEVELMLCRQWEEGFQAEVEREQDLHRRLQQIQAMVDTHIHQITELQERSKHLEKDIQLSSQKLNLQVGDAVKPLQQELQQRLKQGEKLDANLSQTHRKLQAAEERLQDRWEVTEELNKELRQCNLQQFIQQTTVSPHVDQTRCLPATDVLLSNAGIVE